MEFKNKVSLPLSEDYKFLKDINYFFFDCDGVIWNGQESIEGAKELILKLKLLNKSVFFVSNNSTISRKSYIKKFESLGFQVDLEQIISSSFSVPIYLLKQNFNIKNKKVLIVGEQGLIDELSYAGFDCIDGNTIKFDYPNKMEIDSQIGAVVVGFDKLFNYAKIQYAMKCIVELDAIFIASNLDAWAPLYGDRWVGSGSMVAAIQCASGKSPIVTGKPSRILFDYLLDIDKDTQNYSKTNLENVNKEGVELDLNDKKDGLVLNSLNESSTNRKIDGSRCLMIGDRLDTDIAFGKNCNMFTLCVLTGVTTYDEILNETDSFFQPHRFCSSIKDILNFI